MSFLYLHIRRMLEAVAASLRGAVASARRHPVRAVLLPPALLLLYALLLVPFTPSIGDLRRIKAETPSVIMSSDNVVLAEYRRINRQWVGLDEIAPSVIDALIATEDRRFYDHHGIDVVRTVAAVFRTLTGSTQGGSTLTQQLARNLYPEDIGSAITLSRKIKEAITAIKIESVYSKREILETYLNTMPFLYNAFGIEMAARTYFDTSAHELDVLQAATLIGMLKGTNVYNPVRYPERALQRRNLVLAQMARAGKLPAPKAANATKAPAKGAAKKDTKNTVVVATANISDAAQREALIVLARRPLGLDFDRRADASGPIPHVAQQLRTWLSGWADDHNFDIQSDGLVIRTTIDSRLQKAANAAVKKQLIELQKLADARRKRGEAKPPLQAGFLAIDPRNGAVRAWVGSRDFATEQFDHVSQARRQPGSTFKPFVYGAAFMQGMGPETTFIDQEVSITLDSGDVWQPSDDVAPSGKAMTLAEGLAYSKNTITAQLMEKVGPDNVVKLARALGVRDSKLDPVLSLALGTSPVTLREMVTAYGTIANEGHYIEPIIVTAIEDRHGTVLESFTTTPEQEEAMPHEPLMQLLNAMRGTVDVGTGAAIRSRYGIEADVAGKTGTTQDNSDGWFILMHPQLVAGARVGFNDNHVTMGSWGQGARAALPMVGEVFQQALTNNWIDPKAEFNVPKTPPPKAEQPLPDPVKSIFDMLRGIFR